MIGVDTCGDDDVVSFTLPLDFVGETAATKCLAVDIFDLTVFVLFYIADNLVNCLVDLFITREGANDDCGVQPVTFLILVMERGDNSCKVLKSHKKDQKGALEQSIQPMVVGERNDP